MSKPKSKAGKSKKAAARKPAPRKHNARKVAAPKPAAPVAEQVAPVAKTPPEYPWNVIVRKGAERIPVTVTDEAHYQRLVVQFGANHVEVQS